MMKQRITSQHAEARPAPIYRLARGHLAALGLLSLAACGVSEHPHDGGGAVDTSNDFGPSGGAAPSGQGGAPSQSMAGRPAAGGNAAAAGGAPSGTAGSAGVPSGGAATAAGGAATTAGGAPGRAGAPGAAGSPPASGTTINLGGVEVPKDHAIAFIHLGHSNMAGRATSPTASRAYHFTETNPPAFMYHVGTPPVLAFEPNTAGTPDAIRQKNFAGPGTSLVKQAAALAPNHYFISLGYGVPSAYCSQFLPGGLYYDAVMAGPRAIKTRVTFGAIFIYLGITERHGTEADRTGYASCINTLVTAIRTELGEPTLPLVINDYEVDGKGEFVLGGAVATAIMPQIAKIPTTVSNSALVPCNGIGMQDDHHFNLDGHFTWVQRALAIMQQKGWFPWAGQ